jgi:hypothetical protein
MSGHTGANNLGRLIAGTVVDHDDFQIPAALRRMGENLLQRAGDALALVVGGQNDAIGEWVQSSSQAVSYRRSEASLIDLVAARQTFEAAREHFRMLHTTNQPLKTAVIPSEDWPLRSAKANRNRRIPCLFGEALAPWGVFFRC